MTAPGPASRAAGLGRRFASLVYESVVLCAIAFLAVAAFLAASGGREPAGLARLALQVFVLAVFAAYFLWCWLRGGQTLAMRAWRIRVVPGHGERLSSRAALLRFALATLFLGGFAASALAAFQHRDPLLAFVTLGATGIGPAWAFFDRDGQFLHDRLAGTRIERTD